MSKFEFVSHEAFDEDLYVKEIVYLCFDDKYRVAYTRKQAKNGGLFWSTMSAGIQKDGLKTYYESFIQDSVFLDKDIKTFLDNRSWQNKSVLSQPTKVTVEDDDKELPF